MDESIYYEWGLHMLFLYEIYKWMILELSKGLT